MSVLFSICTFLALVIEVTAYSRTYGETDGVDAWVIAVGNIAGLAVIIIAIVFCCCACRRRNQQQGHPVIIQYPPPAGQPGVSYTEPPPPYTAVNAGYVHDDKTNMNGTTARPNGRTQNSYSAQRGVILSPQNTQAYNKGASANRQTPVGMQKYLSEGYNYGTQI